MQKQQAIDLVKLFIAPWKMLIGADDYLITSYASLIEGEEFSIVRRAISKLHADPETRKCPTPGELLAAIRFLKPEKAPESEESEMEYYQRVCSDGKTRTYVRASKSFKDSCVNWDVREHVRQLRGESYKKAFGVEWRGDEKPRQRPPIHIPPAPIPGEELI